MPPHTDATASPSPRPAIGPARNGGSRALIGVVLVVAAGLAMAIWFVVAMIRAVPPPAPDVGEGVTVLRVPMQISPFSITDHRGEVFDASRLVDRWSFLFFGYTYCPDVCPVTLASLRDARKRMVEQSGEASLSDVQFVFVSVDPARDTTERLAQFVPYFHPDFVGATGTPEQLAPLVESLGVYHALSEGEEGAEGESEEGYLLDHTVSLMLVNPAGELHAIFGAPHEPPRIASAFSKIRELGGSR